MGRITRLLSFARKRVNEKNYSDAQSNQGGGANITSNHFSSSGDDSHPINGDSVILVGLPRNNGYAAVGYADTKNQQIAQAGEKRIYSRDDETGVEIASVWLKNDGTIVSENGATTTTIHPDGTTAISNNSGTAMQRPDGSFRISNGSGYLELTSSGSVNINGLIISTSGNATSAGGISLDGHTHSQGADSAGNTQADTNPPS